MREPPLKLLYTDGNHYDSVIVENGSSVAMNTRHQARKVRHPGAGAAEAKLAWENKDPQLKSLSDQGLLVEMIRAKRSRGVTHLGGGAQPPNRHDLATAIR